MSSTAYYAVLTVMLAMTHVGCGRQDEPTASNTSQPARAPIHLTAAVASAAGVRTAPATRAVLAPTVSLFGDVAADPDKSALVASPVPGRLESIAFKEGDRVKKGELLARVSVTEVAKLRGAHGAALARARAARADASRLKGLVDKGIRPEQAYLDAEAAAASAEVEASGLAAQLAVLGAGASSSSLPLVAPLDGVVVARRAVVGAPVSSNEAVATIADLSSAWFLARVFDRDLARVRIGAAATVVLDAHPGDPLSGIVEGTADTIDPLTRAVQVRVRIRDTRGLLKIGLFGTAHIATGAGAGAPVLVVPRTAVVEVAGQKVAFVRAGDGYDLRHVVLGRNDREHFEIVSGVTEGEEVVVEGAFSLKSIALRSTLAEG